MMRKLLISCLMFASFGSWAGCTDFPAPVDKFLSIIESTQYTNAQEVGLVGAKKKTLAVILSNNTVANFDANDRKVGGGCSVPILGAVAKLGAVVTAAVNPALLSTVPEILNKSSDAKPETIEAARVALRSDRMIEGFVYSMRKQFGKVILAKDLVDAFQSGAQYAVVLDVVMGFDNKFSGGMMSMLNPFGSMPYTNTHSIKISSSYFDPQLRLVSELTSESTDVYSGDAKNTSDAASIAEANVMIEGRKKALKDFEAKLIAATSRP